MTTSPFLSILEDHSYTPYYNSPKYHHHVAITKTSIGFTNGRVFQFFFFCFWLVFWHIFLFLASRLSSFLVSTAFLLLGFTASRLLGLLASQLLGFWASGLSGFLASPPAWLLAFLDSWFLPQPQALVKAIPLLLKHHVISMQEGKVVRIMLVTNGGVATPHPPFAFLRPSMLA